MADEKEIVRDYKTIREDYRFDTSIFNAEPDKVARVKEIIDTRLTDVERIIILLYVDCQSYRKLGKRLGISHTLVAQEVRKIKRKILKAYYNIEDD